jgi:hypothetical protein
MRKIIGVIGTYLVAQTIVHSAEGAILDDFLTDWEKRIPTI